MRAFPLRSRTRQGYQLSSFLLNIILEILPRVIRGEKERKDIQTGKEEIKQSQFAGDILYTENTKDSIKKQIELINEFSKAAGHKISIQKYINNELA